MDMDDYILVTVDGEKKYEFECEESGEFLVSTLQSTVGADAGILSYINSATGNHRAVKVRGGVFLPPKDDWTKGTLYWVSKPASIPSNPSSESVLSEPCTLPATTTSHNGMLN